MPGDAVLATVEKKVKKPSKISKFSRGEAVATRAIHDKKLKGKLRHTERITRAAQAAATKVERWLLTEDVGTLEAEGLEQTWRFKQPDIIAAVEAGAAQKAMDLSLPTLGPYTLDFNRSGRHLLLGGRKGHLSLMDWQQARVTCEIQVKETIRSVSFLHNEMFFAAAQKKYVYIYDKRGIEVHCLKEHTEVNQLEFLPYHFLLCSIGRSGHLMYQDTSTGALVARHKTGLGPCGAMCQNTWNSVISLGHGNGTVSMWTPNITTPVVSMLCHRGPVRALAVDPQGMHIVTAGADSEIKVWDVRKFQPLHSYYSPSPCEMVGISQKGLLAVGYGRRIQIWKDALASKASAPYMNHSLQLGVLSGLSFCPYEDVLGVGHSGGCSTMIVPGAGEPNFDSFVADPFQGRKARREAEIHSLLDKLQPEMIVLDPTSIGQVAREPREIQKERQAEEAAANAARRKEALLSSDNKARMKGKNKPTRRRKKKEMHIIEERKPEMKARMREQGVSAEHGHRRPEGAEPKRGVPDNVPRALQRFYK